MIKTSQIKAVLLALLVTFLWSTSFIIIKLGLDDLPPITFAGLRYILAFLCLLPFGINKQIQSEVRSLTSPDWVKLSLLGIIFYTLTQGAQFLGLNLLPAVTVSLLLNFTPLIVAIAGIWLLHEIPTRCQWIGVILFTIGILVYFHPVALAGSRSLGILVMLAGVLANAGAAVLGRNINRNHKLSALTITIISMGIGAAILLLTGIATQGLPPINLKMAGYLIWLAAVNTAVAFTFWNYTLRYLTAMESSLINGTMLIQIAVLAWIFLGEAITTNELAGIILAALGAVLVQLKTAGK